MPVTVTFDIERPTPLELNRLRSAFIRLGWEHLGNTAYRYPRRRSHSCRGLQPYGSLVFWVVIGNGVCG